MEKLFLLLLVAFVIIGIFSYAITILTGFKNSNFVTIMLMLYSGSGIGVCLIGGKMLYNIVTFSPVENTTLMLCTYLSAAVIYIIITSLVGTLLKRNLFHYQLE